MQTTFFDYLTLTGTMYTSNGFISNGSVALAITDWEIESPRMYRMVDHFKRPDTLTPCQMVAQLPPLSAIGWNHDTFVFTTSDQEPPFGLDELIFVNANLYNLIESPDSPGDICHRCDLQWPTGGGTSKVVAVYSYDNLTDEVGNLLGFLADLQVTEENWYRVMNAFNVALTLS